MNSAELRKSFLEFFKAKEHTVVSSDSLVPKNDPTLLFTNAGMNQFKDIFLGEGSRPYFRACNTQKCLRVSGKHNDLEEVGRDTYHHTFFEMLGNWSFGDYYKKEAISWAWEYLTEELKLPKEKLYATVYRTDDEAEELWKQVTDIDHSRILRFDEKDNFWEMGETGPCGPCSEIHIDRGEGFCDKSHMPGHKCGVNAGCARVIEIWNLVFIQYNRDKKGVLTNLPARHVDTGMGFERLCSVYQDKISNYDTDLFVPIIKEISVLSNDSIENIETLVLKRIIADHLRAVSFCVADGILPSNEGQGYVIRRILRRACRSAKKLGHNEPVIYKLVDVLKDIMGEQFPEIIEKRDFVMEVIRLEEERFLKTIDLGIRLFDEILSKEDVLKNKTVPGEDAFKLHDTYGFPLDLTRLMAEEKGFSVDEAGFEKQMQVQKQMAREASRFSAVEEEKLNWVQLMENRHTEFTGYTENTSVANILSYAQIDSSKYRVILDKTPFYAESGGQISDTGTISCENFEFDVERVYKQGDQFIHEGTLTRGAFHPCVVKACIDVYRRNSIRRNHSVTHILQKALKTCVSENVCQRGSFVGPDYLRFDFQNMRSLSPEEIVAVEKEVNKMIFEDLEQKTEVMNLEDAKRSGAVALFDEKYAEEVRVVSFGDYSRELCGGTHVNSTSQIGSFKIISESSVAQGIRRIEAVTGHKCYELMSEFDDLIRSLKSELKAQDGEQILNKVSVLREENKDLQKQIQKLRSDMLTGNSNSDGTEFESNGITIIIREIPHMDGLDLRETADRLAEKHNDCIVFIASGAEDKASLVVKAKGKNAEQKVHCGKVVGEIAPLINGKGGGRPQMAQAGGKSPEKIEEALKKAEDILRELVK